MHLPDTTSGQAAIDSFYDRVRFSYEISEIAANRTITQPVQRMATKLSMDNTDLYRHLTNLAINKEWPVSYEMPKKLTTELISLSSCSPNRLTKTYLRLMREQELWMDNFLQNLPEKSALSQEVRTYLEAQDLISEEDQLLLTSSD